MGPLVETRVRALYGLLIWSGPKLREHIDGNACQMASQVVLTWRILLSSHGEALCNEDSRIFLDACDLKNASQTFSRHYHRVIQEVEMIRMCSWIFIIWAAPGRFFGDGTPPNGQIGQYLWLSIFPLNWLVWLSTPTQRPTKMRGPWTHMGLSKTSSHLLLIFLSTKLEIADESMDDLACFISSFQVSHTASPVRPELWKIFGCVLSPFVFMEIYAAGANSLSGKFNPRQLGVTYQPAYRMKAIIKYIE